MIYKMPFDAQQVVHKCDNDGTWVDTDGVLWMLNQGGHDFCMIDVQELVAWLREHCPHLLK